MISLDRPDAPAVLTPAFVLAGVARHAADGSAVWNVQEIKDALSLMSGDKCSYCEVRLGEGPAYLEVEHFFAKAHHHDRVLDWDNLLPACRRCNAKKSDWDVALPGQMMIDPVLMSPTDHIRLDEAYRPVGFTPEGETSILEIALDDIARLGIMRFKVGEVYKRKLEDLLGSYTGLPQDVSLAQRRRLIRRIKDALQKAGRTEPFSAVIATVMMRSPSFAALKAAMIAAGDWDAELQASDAWAASISLA